MTTVRRPCAQVPAKAAELRWGLGHDSAGPALSSHILQQMGQVPDERLAAVQLIGYSTAGTLEVQKLS